EKRRYRGGNRGERGAEVVETGGGAQALGGKHHVGGNPEQLIGRLRRPVGVEHHGEAACARRHADRTNSGKRLSATTACATSLAASTGVAAASRSSQWVTIMRLPRASMRIAESAVGTPARRWQPVQWISARGSAASTRSPFESSPSGPASAARPPSRAIATAALAAQPPLTMKKLCAWVFASGCGKRSTRNTSSSTMIPAHKIE